MIVLKKIARLAGLCLVFPIGLMAQVERLGIDSIYRDTQASNDSSQVVNPNNTISNDTLGKKLTLWIHGLAGSNKSWNLVQMATEIQVYSDPSKYPTRNTEGYCVDYNADDNLLMRPLSANVTSRIKSFTGRIGNNQIPRYKNIAVAHSQGGIVARSMSYVSANDNPQGYKNLQFGRLATFGTPHGGAAIVNSAIKGNSPVLNRWISEGCQTFTKLKLTELVNSKWWLGLMINQKDISDFSSFACSYFNKTALTALRAQFVKPATNNYKKGASYLNDTLVPHALVDSMPVIVFYGVEESPVLWRTLDAMTNFTIDKNRSWPLLSSNPFGLNADGDLAKHVSNMISHYRSASMYFLNSYRNYSRDRWTEFSFFTSKESLYDRYKDYSAAKHYMEGANATWLRLIGAARDSIVFAGYECDCDGVPNKTRVVHPSLCSHNGSSANCRVTPLTKVVMVEEPSDGVVTQASQMAYPNAVHYIRMDKVNHMQERNSDATRIQLKELFNGNYGPEFQLDKQ